MRGLRKAEGDVERIAANGLAAGWWRVVDVLDGRPPEVAAGMALHVLAYTLTRVMNIMGIKPLIAAIRV